MSTTKEDSSSLQPNKPAAENTDETRSKNGSRSTLANKIQSFRDTCGAIINHDYVQWFIMSLIIIGALLMGVATFPFVRNNLLLLKIFATIDGFCLIIFTIETLMQFIYLGFNLFTDNWLLFDFLIVTLTWAFPTMQIIRSFRIFRALRLINVIKPLRDLVNAMLSVIPRMLAICALLMLVFYIFAVMFTQLFKPLSREGKLSEDYFGDLGLTILTLFQMMTLDWAGVVRDVMQYETWAWFPFLVYVMTSAFIVFNLVVAVICDAVAILHDDEKEAENEKIVQAKAEKDALLRRKVTDLSGQVAQMKSSHHNLVQTIEDLVYNIKAKRTGKRQINRRRTGEIEDAEDDDSVEPSSSKNNGLCFLFSA